MHRYIFDANTNTKWAREMWARKNRIRVKCASGMCGVVEYKQQTHGHTNTFHPICVLVCVAFVFMMSLFICRHCYFRISMVHLPKCSSCQSNYIGLEILQIHTYKVFIPVTAPMVTMMVLPLVLMHVCVCVFMVGCLCVLFSSTWFLNEVSLLCKSSTQALKMNTDTFAGTCERVCVLCLRLLDHNYFKSIINFRWHKTTHSKNQQTKLTVK